MTVEWCGCTKIFYNKIVSDIRSQSFTDQKFTYDYWKCDKYLISQCADNDVETMNILFKSQENLSIMFEGRVILLLFKAIKLS